MKPKIIMIASSILLLLTQETVTDKKTNNKMETSIEKNKIVVRTIIEQVLNNRKTELVKELISEDFAGPRGLKGPDSFLDPVKPLFAGFPDIAWKIEDITAEGDEVMVRWKWQGIHKGQFASFPATGKTITNDGMAVFTLKNGKVISTSTITDRLGFLQQMGAVPEDPSQLSIRKTYKDRVQFIDKFTVPAAAKEKFYERMRINREFIKKLPGFLEDEAYQYTDNAGNLICVTVAHWASAEALNKAKEAVQAEYKKQGFDPAQMFKQMNISLDRYICTEVE